MAFELNDAKREKLKGVINLVGASSSGKTVGALTIAYGMMKEAFPEATEHERWQKIALIDTEHRRSLIYVDMDNEDLPVRIGSFKHLHFDPPHTVERYIEAIRVAKRAPGIEVVVIDSMSHAWQEILQWQQDLGGRYQDWKNIRPVEKQLWAELFDKNDKHVITTMRSKQEYAMEKGGDEKLKVVKLGTKPIQNDQLEYEYMLSFLIDHSTHTALASKDNSGMFKQPSKITVDYGEKIYRWLEVGEDVRAKEKEERATMIAQLQDLRERHPVADEKITGIEKHKNVRTKLEDMDYEWVKKTFGVVTMAVQEELSKVES